MGSEKSAGEVLRAARKLIRLEKNWSPRGWGKGRRMCIDRAITTADGEERSGAWTQAHRFLKRATRTPAGTYMGEWNDRPHRTHKQVLRAFDKAIALAETGERK